MNALTKFKKMYLKLPKKARTELVMNFTTQEVATLEIVWLEASHNTKTGKKWLKKLGYKDDK